MNALQATLTALLIASAQEALAQGASTSTIPSFEPAGALVRGSGTGRSDNTLYVPGMRFPLEDGPAFANSQVWGHGGNSGPGGGQCDDENYSYPWRDNYCETRSWTMPLCPAGTGHQGQDIRAATCERNVHWAVAAVDGTITNIGSYSVSLITAEGTIHRYLHMEPSSVAVSVGARVRRGQRLGRVSNAFGGSATTIHLHYDIEMNVAGSGFVYVPPYTSLVRSYEDLLAGREDGCAAPLASTGGVIDDRSTCFRLQGPPATWRRVTGQGEGGELFWSYAWENAASNWAEWILAIETSGRYDVDVAVPPGFAGSQSTRYTVRHANGEDELRIDQSASTGWIRLGTFDLGAGISQRVAVYDGPGEAASLMRRFVADAVRVTPVTPPAADAGVTFDAGPRLDAGAIDAGAIDAGVSPDSGAIPDPDASVPAPDARPPISSDAAPPPDAGDELAQLPAAFEGSIEGGCACSHSERPRSGLGAALLLALLALRRRR